MTTSNNLIKIIFIIFLLKLLAYLFISYTNLDLYKSGNDSDYYDAYALGKLNYTTSVWPMLLRILNDIGLYSREGVSFTLKIMGIILIPLGAAWVAKENYSPISNKCVILAFLIYSIYPTIFYYTNDIYRDVFMIFIFILALVAVRNSIWQNDITLQLFWLFIFFILSIVLFGLRPYLGFSTIAAYFISKVINLRKFPTLLWIIAYFIFLYLAFLIGALDPIMAYRQNFTSGILVGEANLGINFQNKSLFLIDLSKSYLYQLFGFYWPNKSSMIAFLLESLPFILALAYVVKSRQQIHSFTNYLLIFFFIYNTFWILGNDNLGSAVRLRVFSYLAIYICLFISIQRNDYIKRIK
ncbi:hypothetical protein [Alcaligenes sp. SDU_A2]|uniref:hypothetical protein n=1 Tax=Alcaligenes sp. SDU_A2 TaxID=3136634 RepID=UPI00312037FD